MKHVLLLILAATTLSAQDKATKIDEFLSRYHTNGQFNGTVLVSEGGKVIYKKGFGLANMEWEIPNTPDTKFRLGSITKQFTAAVILQLVNEGKIGLNDKLSQYIPDYPKKTADRVTIHQLLNHTSGIPSYTGLPNFMRDKVRDAYTPLDLVKVFWEMDLEFEPGSRFRYNNSGYHLLGVIIEKVTGKTYAEALRERIFDPLKMSASGYDLNQPLLLKRAGAYERTLDGYQNAGFLDMTIPYAAGSLYSTVEDLYTWDQALYTDKVLPAKSKDLMFTPALDNYAYGWVVRKSDVLGEDRKITVIGHGGGIHGFNTLIERIPSDKHLIVLLNNTGGTRLNEISHGITKVLYGLAAPMPKIPASTAMYKIIQTKDVKTAIAECRSWKTNASNEYDVNPGELGMVTDYLTSKKRLDEAEEIAKLNVELHPKVAPVHYRLGEVYRAAKKRELAIQSYARALELSPGNPGPIGDRLKEMLVK
ncbi:MAG TPA: serine hydrolase [Bryobacteraceae bacterium]|nr:serine hydrolase [Bryobacteraceae bacterium]